MLLFSLYFHTVPMRTKEAVAHNHGASCMDVMVITLGGRQKPEVQHESLNTLNVITSFYFLISVVQTILEDIFIIK